MTYCKKMNKCEKLNWKAHTRFCPYMILTRNIERKYEDYANETAIQKQMQQKIPIQGSIQSSGTDKRQCNILSS